ncbi:MAG: hypothetical protein M3Q48_14055 [Actinomycetota bacterium]|nr:hypothetical protein [Actinomycetota bacterium]
MSVATAERQPEIGTASRRPAWREILDQRRGEAVVALAFLLSRVAIGRAGVVFDQRPLNDAFQLLDRGLLRDDLLRSVAHLHSQPPLFNLFIGLGLQFPPRVSTPLFRGLYLAVGLGLALTLHAVLRRMRLRPAVAAGVAVAFTLSPSVFLYESWLHYDYPVTLMLALAVLALQRYEDGHRPRDAALFVGLLAALVLTRSVFHIVWFAAWVAVLVLHRRRADWRRVVAVAAVPALAVVGLHVHRLAQFGTFGSSTLLGMSVAKITTFQLPPAQRRALVARGELSRLALADPLAEVSVYRRFVPLPPRTGVKALDASRKGVYSDPPTHPGFRANFNHLIYVDVSKRYLADAVRTIRMRPGAYLQGVATAFNIYFRPASDFFTLYDNRQQVKPLDDLYNIVVHGVVSGREGSRHLPDPGVRYQQGPGRTAWFVLAAYVVAFVGGAVALWRARRRDGPAVVPPIVLAFLWSTVVYVTAVSNLIEVGENNRFRLYADPLVIALIAALVVGRFGRAAAPTVGAER